MKQRNSQRPAEAYTDHSHIVNGGGATLVFATKVDEHNMSIGHSTKNNMKSDTSTFATFKAANHLNPVMANKGAPFPVSLQQNILMPVRNNVVTQSSTVVVPDLETRALQTRSHMAQTKPWPGECTALNNKLKEKELDIQGGTISISSAYSRG